jgi:hypothetical protein
MVDFVETPNFDEAIAIIETGEKVLGGAGGPANRPLQALANRTRYLKDFLDGIVSGGIGGVILMGVLETQAELDAIPTEGLKVGTAYFLNFEMRVWNGTEWGNSGSLRGERGLNILGVWPDAVPLPDHTQNVIGDAYLWKNDIHVLVPSFDPEDPEASDLPPIWEGLGIRGPDGKSTFDIYREQPGNANKTQAQFLAEQKGEQGDDAYEAWLKIPVNEGKSREQWVEETRGLQGEVGPARGAFVVAGSKANAGQLPTPGDETKAWYVGIDLYVWVEADQNYIMIPGIAGKSAYTIWLESDPEHEGQTEAQFLESLKGAKGNDSVVPGPKGDDGRNLRILGTVGTSSELAQLEDPVDQDAYATLDTGRLWMFLPLEGGWKDLGPWRGVDGKSAFEVWQDNGHPEGTPAEFFASLKGKDGINMEIRGVVATLAALPAVPQEQWLYAVQDERSFYLYLDGAWANIGTYGIDGVDGKDGKSLDIVKILTEEDDVPPAADANTKGKAYISWNPRDVYVNVSGGAWENAGPFMPLGQQGIQGVAFRPKGTVMALGDLPPIGGDGNAVEGDTYSVIEEGKKLYTVVDGQWSGPLDIVGPMGKDGPQGIPGALMPIKGVYKTMALLRAAHPTGALGDAYMIIDPDALPEPIRNLAIWSVEGNDWVDTGPSGIKGEQGNPGNDSTVPGPQGEKGSQWLTLATQDAPSAAFNGRPGDWAVNQLLRVYYKTVNQGWVYWGQLVAGDVNSPLLAEGKVVRLGNTWIPLPVDEVESPVEGEFYARKKVGEDQGNPVMAWAALPDIIADLQTKHDTKQFVRVYKTTDSVPVWAELQLPAAGISDIANPKDGALYLRFAKNGTWVEYIPAPNDAKQYVQKGGNWISFDRYDMPVKAMSATGSVDPTVDQVVALDNSAVAAKTITLGDGPKGANARAQTLIVTVTGSAGVVSFAATGATTLSWHGGTPPTLSGSVTNIVFWWTGSRWIGQLGAVVP